MYVALLCQLFQLSYLEPITEPITDEAINSDPERSYRLSIHCLCVVFPVEVVYANVCSGVGLCFISQRLYVISL